MANKAEILYQIAMKYDLDIIYAFGSRSKEVAEYVKKRRIELSVSPLSDVDIGVKPGLGKRLSIKEKVHMSLELEDFFGANRVDLVVIPEVDPFLAVNVIRGERIFCKDEYKADEYDLYILRRAGDLVPLERERLSLIMEEKNR